MKKTFILTIVILTAAAFSTVSAQVTPAGAGDKDLRDTNVKGRSNELERIKRDAQKPEKRGKDAAPGTINAAEAEDALAAKYEEIKMDYEQIQLSQDSIIKAYQSGDKIDYIQISKYSSEISKSAMRLSSNLFPAPVVENTDAKKVESSNQKKVEKAEKEMKNPKNVRDIIVELDNTIGSFATSSMFQNLRTIDPAISEKTRVDLEKIIELSALLGVEAENMSKIRAD